MVHLQLLLPLRDYLFLVYPTGHLGLSPTTDFTVFPRTHLIVIFFTTGFAGVGATAIAGSFLACANVTRIVGLENVKPEAESESQPPFSARDCVCTLAVPLSESTETVALIGAVLNP